MRILIIGGGRLTEGLLVSLLDKIENIYVEIVEISQSRANHLAVLDTTLPTRGKPLNTLYGKSYVIATLDALSEDFLRNYPPESLESFDKILVGTGDDMTNIRILAKIMKNVIAKLQKEKAAAESEEEKEKIERRIEEFRKKVVVRIKDPLFEKFVVKLGAKVLSLTAIRGILMLEMFVNTFILKSDNSSFKVHWISPERKVALISIDFEGLKNAPRFSEGEKNDQEFISNLLEFLIFLAEKKYSKPEFEGELRGEVPDISIIGLRGKNGFDYKLPRRVFNKEEEVAKEISNYDEMYLFVTIPEGIRELLSYLVKKRVDKLKEINALLKEIYAGKEEETIKIIYFLPKEEKEDIELRKRIRAVQEELSRRAILSPEIAREKDEKKEEDELKTMIKEVLSNQYSQLERRVDRLVRGIEDVEKKIGPGILENVIRNWEDILNRIKDLEREVGYEGRGIPSRTSEIEEKILRTINLMKSYEEALKSVKEEEEKETEEGMEIPKEEAEEKEDIIESTLLKKHPVISVFSHSDRTDIQVLLATSIIMDTLEKISRYGWYLLVIYDPIVKSLLEVGVQRGAEYSEIKAKSVLEDGAELAMNFLLGIENFLSLIFGEGREVFSMDIPEVSFKKTREEVIRDLFSPSRFLQFIREKVREDLAENLEVLGIWISPNEEFRPASERSDLIFFDFTSSYEYQEPENGTQKIIIAYKPRVSRVLIAADRPGIKDVLPNLEEYREALEGFLRLVYLYRGEIEKEETERWKRSL